MEKVNGQIATGFDMDFIFSKSYKNNGFYRRIIWTLSREKKAKRKDFKRSFEWYMFWERISNEMEKVER